VRPGAVLKAAGLEGDIVHTDRLQQLGLDESSKKQPVFCR